jgi:OFA family oxalate/formate antiporter-like MFS transporter
MKNKTLSRQIFRGIIPAFLLTGSVGMIYSFSIFSNYLVDYFNVPLPIIQWSFVISIFFLGMSAAFGGKLVENNIRKSTILGTIFFISGLICSGLSITLNQLWMLYLGIGVLCGIGEGLIYISPVKCLMMHFPNKRGIASAIPIISFGLGSTICAYLFKFIFPFSGLEFIFYYLAGIYSVFMIIGSILLKKPFNDSVFKINSIRNLELTISDVIHSKYFINEWLFMLTNISCGLILIGYAKPMMLSANYSLESIITIVALMGILNAVGRFLFATISDILPRKSNVIWIICIISILSLCPCIFNLKYIWIPLLLISACYGGGFSTCPNILHQKFGMAYISTLHGWCLSAWGIASVLGGILSALILSIGLSFSTLITIISVIYFLEIVFAYNLEKDC